jgi:GT2 family glycosyltransferase/glycosyltransferase involved in cell wall biosynthesis
MTRLLVFGLCPLPFENTPKNFGPGIRAWQFIKPAIDSGVEVCLIANRIPYVYPKDMPCEIVSESHGFKFYNMSDDVFRQSSRIQSIHDDFQPDAILAATLFACVPLSGLNTSCPVWIDLFGHVMAEAQAKAYRYQDNTFLEHFFNHELTALQYGDIFSAVSNAQSFATIGELGLVKRLVAETTGYNFCHTVPCAVEPGLYTHDKTVVRGIEVPESSFIVLWSGGFNTWTDTDTLVTGLEAAMAQNTNIRFVSTGGQIDGHDEITYPAFCDRIRQSPFADRFILKGWIQKNNVHNYYFESNVGINIDTFMYEGLFGSKNRILDWMRAGLPAIVGELCELSYDLSAKGLAYSYPLQNPQALADTILDLSRNPESVRATGLKAQKYGFEHLSFHKTTETFQCWLKKPQKAPDKTSPSSFNRSDSSSIQPGSQHVQKLERELKRKNGHIKELEKYIHKLESMFYKKDTSLTTSVLPENRPVIAGHALRIPENACVSIIIVTWNAMADIDDCLQSVFFHDYPDVECIVIDNGSTDGTADHIKNKYPNLILCRNIKNEGFTNGVNQGLLQARGDVIFLLNQDAAIQPGLLRELVKVLSNKWVGIAGCKILHPDNTTIQHAGGILHKNGLTDHIGANETDSGQYDEDKDVTYVTGAAFAFKKKLLSQIGQFDTRFFPAYYEELDFCYRASLAGYRIVYCHKAIATHRESTSTGKFSSRFYYLYHRNRLKFILKHFPLRYLLGTFRRYEWKWIRQHAPREQMIPLLRAYISVLHRFAWSFIRDSKRKVMS